jgi:uncharacterized membrane protein
MADVVSRWPGASAVRLAAGTAGSVKFAGFPLRHFGAECGIVIELVPSLVSGTQAQLMLRPRRALTARQFQALFVVLAGATWVVAIYSFFAMGNVFAPPFALLDTVFVAVSLRCVWRDGERFERIALSERTLEVHRSAQAAPTFQAHPYWVRLSVQRKAGTPRVWLGSQGKQVEVGAFLSEVERLDLADRLKALLAAAVGPRRDTDNH